MDDILDTAPCGFLSFADDGSIVLVNATLASMLGHGRDALRNQNVEQIFTVGSRIFYQTHFFPLLRLQGNAEEIYLTLRARDGSEVPVLLNATRRERDGSIANDCMIFSVRQRGEYEDKLLKAKKAAEEATRARDDMLAVVSHELRAPLHAILGWAQIMRLDPDDQRAIVEGLDTIERNARAQSRLIEDLLDVSRVVAGKLRLTMEPLDPSSIVQAAVDVVRPAADAKSIRIDTALDPSPCIISGDPDRLQQVLWNLLSNAVKFTPERGSVRVELRRGDSAVEIEVSDTGCGMDPEFLPYVFERFHQSERQNNVRRHGGLGLGMAITKEIVQLHGGTIRANSEGEGQGSQFVVSLPIHSQHESADDADVSATSSTR